MTNTHDEARNGSCPECGAPVSIQWMKLDGEKQIIGWNCHSGHTGDDPDDIET